MHFGLSALRGAGPSTPLRGPALSGSDRVVGFESDHHYFPEPRRSTCRFEYRPTFGVADLREPSGSDLESDQSRFTSRAPGGRPATEYPPGEKGDRAFGVGRVSIYFPGPGGRPAERIPPGERGSRHSRSTRFINSEKGHSTARMIYRNSHVSMISPSARSDRKRPTTTRLDRGAERRRLSPPILTGAPCGTPAARYRGTTVYSAVRYARRRFAERDQSRPRVSSSRSVGSTSTCATHGCGIPSSSSAQPRDTGGMVAHGVLR